MWKPENTNERSSSPPQSSSSDRWTAWDCFLKATHETGFMQSSWWADFRSTVGFEHFATILKDRETIYGGALVQKFSFSDDGLFYYIQDGPVLPADESLGGEVFEAFLRAIENRRKTEHQTVSHLRIEPRWQRLPEFVKGFQPAPSVGDRFIEPRNTLCIDLRLSEDALLAQMKSKGRYNIRVAQKHGLAVVEDNSERGLENFLEMYTDMARRQNIDAKPPEYFVELWSTLSTVQRGSLFFAEYRGVRLAAALVVYFGKRATYFYGASLDEHRNVMAPYTLHFEIMRKAKSMGCEWYDFWGVAPLDQPDHSWRDISVFKRKFGGVEVSLVPTLDLVYDSSAYQHYVTEERDEPKTAQNVMT